MSDEFTRIVEYSFIPKQDTFVIRFLSGESYVLNTADLPKKLQTKKPDWENTVLSDDKNAIVFQAGKDYRQIPFHTIHSRGKLL